jgi:hypothetical protein
MVGQHQTFAWLPVAEEKVPALAYARPTQGHDPTIFTQSPAHHTDVSARFSKGCVAEGRRSLQVSSTAASTRASTVQQQPCTCTRICIKFKQLQFLNTLIGYGVRESDCAGGSSPRGARAVDCLVAAHLVEFQGPAADQTAQPGRAAPMSSSTIAAPRASRHQAEQAGCAGAGASFQCVRGRPVP